MAEIPLNVTIPFVDPDTGIPTATGAGVLSLLVRTANLQGSGSPEGVIAAPQGRTYLDEDTNTYYFKKLTDIGLDESLGWVAV